MRNLVHINAFLDKWISRENEDEMRIRLRKEQEEASGDSMSFLNCEFRCFYRIQYSWNFCWPRLFFEFITIRISSFLK
jgi:hypothetical protein